jgi:MFS-type transporter involved in bile tolerance (Atg22 family)
MHPLQEELELQGFELLEKLDHQALVPFLQRYLKKKTAYSIFYYLFNFLFLVLLGYLFTVDFQAAHYSFATRFSYFSYGILLAFALVPLHEYLHVLAYRSQGAQRTSYAANWKKFYFMALADGFVADRKAFRVVALTPFVVITGLLSVLLLVADANGTLLLVTTILAHASMCGGDFGLLSFFACHKDAEVVTFDDVPGQMSYFLRKG